LKLPHLESFTLKVSDTINLKSMLDYDICTPQSPGTRSLANFLSQLRSLTINVTPTNIVGEAHWSSLSHGRHSQRVFNLIHQASNLEHLHLCLDLNLTYPPACSFRRLKTLSLADLRASVSHLKTILTCNLSTLSSLKLSHIKLLPPPATGTMEEIFLHCLHLPNLIDVDILPFNDVVHCLLSNQNQNQTQTQTQNQDFPIPPPNSRPILHQDERDARALGDLVRLVHKRRLEKKLGESKAKCWVYARLDPLIDFKGEET
jgi:hypothetical protein